MSTLLQAVPLGNTSYLDESYAAPNTFGIEIDYYTAPLTNSLPAHQSNIPNPLAAHDYYELSTPLYTIDVVWPRCTIGCAPPPPPEQHIVPEPSMLWPLLVVLLVGNYLIRNAMKRS